MPDTRYAYRHVVGRTYYTLCGDYGPGPYENERDTLREVVDLYEGLDERAQRAARCIERREVQADGNATVDTPVARYSLDGRRPHDFDYAAQTLAQAQNALRQANAGMNMLGVMPSEAVAQSHLTYARGALKTLDSARKIIERGIEEALREAKRNDELEAARA